MQTIELRRPSTVDFEELRGFFHLVVSDTFEKEGISHLAHDREKEIEDKCHYLRMDLDTNGRDRYFYLALHNGNIIGTIEYGPSSPLIHHLTHGALDRIPEIGTVFVHPDFQGQGVANVLLNAIFLTLLGNGYTRAQQVWRKKFGEPTYLFPNYWGNGTDHMIWKGRVSDQPLRFVSVINRLP
ncbi:N-acetyltransferase family protein [Brevibacillus panacihumi]|uniref:GNAT family N-acetyltransferase n=1 Tax=Brevibacillus panacihumi TaxID=497735 RepID=UPI003D1C2F43